MIRDKRKILKLKNEYSKKMMTKHSLTGIGVGFKVKNGKKTDKIGLVFMVEKKLPKKEIPDDKLLPSILKDVECDVIETGKIKALAFTSKIRPAVPGYSCGHPDVTAGTLGCVVYKGTNKCILSNNHVMANENAANIGDPIYQPGVVDGGVAADTVAYLDSFILIEDNVNVDCALAIITDDDLVTNIGQWGNSVDSHSDPSLEDTVYKTGRTTENTEGTVTAEHADVYVGYTDLGTILITDCFITTDMSEGGDSGSVVRSSDTNAVGLLFAGSSTQTIHNYMSNVVTQLGFTFTEPITKYWVGGTDNWNATAESKWSLTSGGAGGASIPTSSEVVVIESGICTITESVVAGKIIHTAGILDTNEQTLTISGTFNTTGDSARTLDLSSSTINCEGFTYSGSNLTFTEGTSIIKITGTASTFNGNGETFYEVQLNENSHSISGANTFTNLTRTGTSVITDDLILSADQTITGTFTVSSGSATNRISIKSNVSGTQRTITSATFTIDYAAFQDIVCAGAGAPAVPTSAQDLGNNSGITFPTANRYWVGGTGNWSDGTNHWSLTSNGSPGHTLPGISDNVYFDSNSHNDNYTVTVDVAFYSKDLTFAQPSSGAITFSNEYNLYIYGSFTLVSGMTYSSTGDLYFKATDGGHTTTLDGNIVDNNFYFDGVNGEWILQDEFDIGYHMIMLTNGSLNTNNVNVICAAFYSTNTNTRSLTLGSSTLTLNYGGGYISVWQLSTITNLTFDSGTSKIIMTGPVQQFHGGGKTYYDVEINTTSNLDAQAIIYGSNTFNNFTKSQIDVTQYDLLLIDKNQTIDGTLTFNGLSNSQRLEVRSFSEWIGYVTATQVILTANSLTASYIDIGGMKGAGIANWDLSSTIGGSGNCGGNTDITFTEAVNQHWINSDGGNWSDVGNWTSRIPLPQDDVYFDCAFGISKTIELDMTKLGRNIDLSEATWTTSLTLNTAIYEIHIFGSITLASGLSITGITNSRFRGSNDITLTTNGVTIPYGIRFTPPNNTSTLYLGSDLINSSYLSLIRGNFSAINGVDNYSFSFNTATFFNATTATLGSATHSITGTKIDFYSNAIVNAGTSTIKFTDNSSSNKTFYGAGKTFYNFWNATQGSGILTIDDSNTFNNIKIDAGRTVKFEKDKTQTVNTFTAIGEAGNLIVLDSDDGSTPFTLNKSGGDTINCEYLDISNSIVTPADTWSADNSIDGGNNSGWSFTVSSIKKTETLALIDVFSKHSEHIKTLSDSLDLAEDSTKNISDTTKNIITSIKNKLNFK